MNKNKTISKFAGAAVVMAVALAIASQASAAVFFTEDFSDNSVGPDMQVGGNWGVTNQPPYGTTGVPTSYNGAFTVGDLGHYGNASIRTVDASYFNRNFLYEVTVNFDDVNNTGYSSAVIGMGVGDIASANPGFGATPDLGVMFTALGASGGAIYEWDNRDISNMGTAPVVSGGIGKTDDPFRVRMTWNKDTQLALLQIDKGYTGTFASDYSFTLNGADNGFVNGVNARLYLAGGDGVSFDDILVSDNVPEPSTVMLFGLGGMLIWRRKRGSQRQ